MHRAMANRLTSGACEAHPRTREAARLLAAIRPELASSFLRPLAFRCLPVTPSAGTT